VGAETAGCGVHEGVREWDLDWKYYKPRAQENASLTPWKLMSRWQLKPYMIHKFKEFKGGHTQMPKKRCTNAETGSCQRENCYLGRQGIWQLHATESGWLLGLGLKTASSAS